MGIEVGYAVAEAFVACVANRKREIEAVAGQYRKAQPIMTRMVSAVSAFTRSHPRIVPLALLVGRHVGRDLAADTPGTAKVLLQRVRGTA